MSHFLDEIVRAQKRGEVRGIASICSAHPWVLKAAMRRDGPVLIESTCNQVNQFGGYTGMTPADFVAFVRELAAENSFPPESLLLGGDHLGPSPWQDEPAASAMAKATEMVRLYIRAGFDKFHLDASMRLADDPSGPLDPEVSVFRMTELACAAEESVLNPAAAPRYVIGTEVPIPGGAISLNDRVRVTNVEDVQRTIETTHTAFLEAGLESAWERVIAVVVQPGVEFGDDFVSEYQPLAARDLSRFIESQAMVYEVHSTDYQTREALRNLVGDHFAILKIGPGLTYAFREAIFALAMIENELFPILRSNLIQVLDEVMIQHPEHWKKYYRGSEEEQAVKRKSSFSDRSRYYWSDPRVQAALKTLMKNLSEKPLPLFLLGQFAPRQYEQIRRGEIAWTPEGVIFDRIREVLLDYEAACGG
jgi:D-tagatose-1,6-bisphosphate aldolase subunit GatZ/KbaZ